MPPGRRVFETNGSANSEKRTVRISRTVLHLSERHQLSLITDTSDEGVEFILGFSYEEEAWGETVFVGFREQKVIDWFVVD